MLESRLMLTYATFAHPGILNTAADFTRMATQVAANAQPSLEDWQNLQANSYAQLGLTPNPQADVDRGGSINNFAKLWQDEDRAYDDALEWKVTGNVAYANQAVTFLNAWSSTNTEVTGDSDRFLASGLYGFQWANIAEIMRTYSGWSAANITQFQNYLLNVFYPMNNDFLTNHNGAVITNYWANWDLCNLSSEMAIGIFCDNHTIYNQALNYIYNGDGNGAFDKAIYYIQPGNLGQGQEEGRDQGHSNLDFAMLGQICQMAWNQGDDLFSYHNNEILAGMEYLAKYNLANNVPYTTYAWESGDSGPWEQQTTVSNGSRGQLRPIFELFYNHYVTMEGLSAPYTTQALMDYTRPEGDNGNGDEYSWGTLTFDLAPNTTVEPPQDLVAYEKGTGNIQLDWWGGANDTSFNIYRSTSATGTYTEIASGLSVDSTTYTDTGLSTGTYYYKVTGVSGSTETAASNVASATGGTLLVGKLTFNQTSGTTVTDTTGNGMNGTLNGGASFASGMNGSNALLLDGSSGYVSLPAGAIYDLSDFTIDNSVYINSSQSWARVFDFGDGRGDWMFLTIKNGSGVPQFSDSTTYGNNEQSVTGTSALPTNQWVNLAVTFSNRLATLYVNGIAVGSNANMDFPPYEINGGMPNSWIGRSQYSTDPYFSGMLQNFEVYRGAMPAGQVYTLATDKAPPVVPAAPATLTATTIPGDLINLSWSSVSGATSYSLYRATTSGGPYEPIATLLSGNTYTDSGLANDTTYYYVVDAADAGGDGALSAQAQAIARPPLPSVPTSLTAKALSGSSVSLSWTAGANDYTYSVFRSTISGGPYTLVTSGISTTTYTDTGLLSGTTYYYVIQGDNTSGQSANSNEQGATPTNLFLHLKFDETSGSIAYDASPNGWNGTLINSPTWTTAGKVNTSLNLNSAASQYVSLPSGVVAGQTSFTASAWVYLTTSTTWMRVFDFGTGTTNYMFLSVKNSTGVPRFAILVNGSSNGEQGINGTSAIPTGVWTHLAVTWSNNVGTLYVNGIQVGQNTNMTWNPSSLGTTTQNYIGHSEWSADPYLNGDIDDFRLYASALTAAQIKTLATTTAPPAPAGLTAATVSPTQVKLSWSAAIGATTYDIYRATTPGGPFTQLTQVASNIGTTSWQDTGVTAALAAGTTYYYVVSAEDAGGEGAQSTQASTLVLPPAPVATDYLNARVATSASLLLSWDAVTNAASYTVWRSTTQGGPYTSITSGITNTTYTDTGLTNGTIYYYVVTSINATGTSGNSPEAFAAPTDQWVHLKFDETNGTTASDSSGHGELGTLVNGASWTSNGKIGGAVSLNGSSQYVALPNGVVSSLTDTTLSAWVYLNATSAWIRLFDIGTSTNNFMFLTLHNGSNVPQFSIDPSGGTSQSIYGTSAFPTGVWTHVAVTLTGSVGTLYINGVQVGQNTSMTNTPNLLGTTTQSWIGHSEWSADPYLNGQIDDFRIYARALSASEVQALAATAVPPPPTNVTAAAGSGVVALAWTASAGASGYNVSQSTASGGPYTMVAGNISSTTFTNTGLNAGTRYYYVVTALSAGGESENSAEVNALPVAMPGWLSSTSSAIWYPASHTLTVNGPTSIIADPGTDEPIVQASGSAAVIALNPTTGTDIHLGGLSLANGAEAIVTSLGSARSLTNYHLLVIGTPGATAAPMFTIDSTSTLDLADNDMAILYGSGTSPLSRLQEDLQTGANYNGATGLFQWNGPGLISSLAPTTGGATGLGYATESELSAISEAGGGSALTTFDGQSLGSNAILVKYTLMGDSTLSGTVTGTDYNAVLANYDSSGDWSQGNFHYGGTYTNGTFTDDAVGGQDYNIVLSNYDNSLSSYLPGGAGTPAIAPTSVPSVGVTHVAQATATAATAPTVPGISSTGVGATGTSKSPKTSRKKIAPYTPKVTTLALPSTASSSKTTAASSGAVTSFEIPGKSSPRNPK